MHYPVKSYRGVFAVLSITVLLLLSAPIIGAENTITLPLNDSSQSEPANGNISNALPNDSTIIVPPVEGAPHPYFPDVKGASAVIIDAKTGQVLYEKNAHTRRPNASTTKMMTAILLIEHCKMTDIITASKNASLTPFTSLHLKPGEKITVKDLLTGMLVRSANDAAVAAAEHISGSTARFAKLMNEKAKEIGCKDTHFVTPNGLWDPNHYSSAYDLALIARYAMRYPEFNEAVNTRRYYLNSRTINKEDLLVATRCKFLKNYPGADGVKSGYIRQARYCYVGSATHNGWRLVSAVLRSENATNDTVAMMDYGFVNFEPRTVAEAQTPCSKAEVKGGAFPAVEVAPSADLTVVVPKRGAKITTHCEIKSAEAPITKGAKLGTLTASVDGKQVAQVELRAVQDVDISNARKTVAWMKAGGIILFAGALVGRVYGTTFAKNSRRRRRGVPASL